MWWMMAEINKAFSFWNRAFNAGNAVLRETVNIQTNIQLYWQGALSYKRAYDKCSGGAVAAFVEAEKHNAPERSLANSWKGYLELAAMNTELATREYLASTTAMTKFVCDNARKFVDAFIDALGGNVESIPHHVKRTRMLLETVTERYPRAIMEIKSEFGCHFDSSRYEKVAETDRAELYQVFSNKSRVFPTPALNPVMIVPPYVLGVNILDFLPGENKSYVGAFADQWVPTYIKVPKDIDTTPAVQTMTGEDDAEDIFHFCRAISEREGGKKVTLNGFCQGGFLTLRALLSTVLPLERYVGAHITCVTPVDGSRSKSLKKFMERTPPGFRDIFYAAKKLPNGNLVIDGSLMGWVFKLRSPGTQAPIPTFHRDLEMFDRQSGPLFKIDRTAAAINHWLAFDQKNLSVEITRLSFESYTQPIDEQGNLPGTLFGRKLNLKILKEKSIPWLVCIADNDDLVDKEVSLAPLKYMNVEVCVFPKGHAAIATSWSNPASEYSVHAYFSSSVVSGDNELSRRIRAGYKVMRGPVCFHLEHSLKRENKSPVEVLPPKFNLVDQIVTRSHEVQKALETA